MATWNGTSGDDVYSGTEFDDYINGLLGNDTLYGLGGNDTMVGGWGNDALYGGDDDDVMEGGAGTDHMDGGAGLDTMWMYYAGASVTADLAAGTVTGGETTGDTYTAIENLTGAYDFANMLYVDANANVLIGGIESDELSGREGSDTLYGWRGADTLLGGDGDDYLYDDRQDLSRGSEGDSLDGGVGADVMAGGLGDDIYYVDNPLDLVSERDAEGFDIVHSTASSWVMGGNVEKIILDKARDIDATGNSIANVMVGNRGSNELLGLEGNDSLRGGGDNDMLDGGLGNDVLLGGGGDDILIGGFGADRLTGDLGNDLFTYNAVSDSAAGGLRDLIRDFLQGADRFDVSAIDAVAGGDDDAFTYIGRKRFTGEAGELRAVDYDVGRTVISGDVDGDGVADFQAVVLGSHTLTVDDFIL